MGQNKEGVFRIDGVATRIINYSGAIHLEVSIGILAQKESGIKSVGKVTFEYDVANKRKIRIKRSIKGNALAPGAKKHHSTRVRVKYVPIWFDLSKLQIERVEVSYSTGNGYVEFEVPESYLVDYEPVQKHEESPNSEGAD